MIRVKLNSNVLHKELSILTTLQAIPRNNFFCFKEKMVQKTKHRKSSCNLTQLSPPRLSDFAIKQKLIKPRGAAQGAGKSPTYHRYLPNNFNILNQNKRGSFISRLSLLF